MSKNAVSFLKRRGWGRFTELERSGVYLRNSKHPYTNPTALIRIFDIYLLKDWFVSWAILYRGDAVLHILIVSFLSSMFGSSGLPHVSEPPSVSKWLATSVPQSIFLNLGLTSRFLRLNIVLFEDFCKWTVLFSLRTGRAVYTKLSLFQRLRHGLDWWSEAQVNITPDLLSQHIPD